jgi:hypothetical protein
VPGHICNHAAKRLAYGDRSDGAADDWTPPEAG